ncbi:hypothetical protein HK096_005536, partial [Nowakowskiella sp. JEL0078]
QPTKQIQMKNSTLQQLISDFGIENASSDLLPFSIYPPEPRIFHTLDELPYPPEIIDDMVNSYFEKFSYWPLNFLHIPSFFSNRYTIPRALLGIICTRGSKFSKYTPILSLQNEVSTVLLQYAKKNFDLEDLSMNGLITNFMFVLCYMDLGRSQDSWVYKSSLMSMVRLLKLSEDPEVIEEETGVRFSLIEKEERRRIWWALRIINFNQNTILKDYPVNGVQIPLSLEIFELLSDSHENSVIPITVARTFSFETIGFELMQIEDQILKFHDKTCRKTGDSFDFVGSLLAATQIYADLQRWFETQPDWFKKVPESNNVYVSKHPPKNSGKVPWLVIFFHAIYHSLSMFPYRFLLIYISGSKALEPPQIELFKDFISNAIGVCQKHQNELMDILKNLIIPLDLKFEHFHPVIIFAISHSAIFSSVMSHYDEIEELRLKARKDYEFLISYFNAISNYSQYKGLLISNDIENFDKVPPSEKKIEIIHLSFTRAEPLSKFR